MNDSQLAMERRDEILAEQYERLAKDFLRMAKEWADKGVYANYYESAHRCCLKSEAYEALANDLRRPKLIRLGMEANGNP